MDTNNPNSFLKPTQPITRKMLQAANWAALNDPDSEFRVVFTANNLIGIRKFPAGYEGGVHGDTVCYTACYRVPVANRSLAQREFKKRLPVLMDKVIGQFCGLVSDQIRHIENGAKDRPSSRLQARRKAAGLSQSQLAQKAGIAIGTLQQYEQGLMNINHAAGDKVDRLCKVLRCKPKDIFEP